MELLNQSSNFLADVLYLIGLMDFAPNNQRCQLDRIESRIKRIIQFLYLICSRSCTILHRLFFRFPLS